MTGITSDKIFYIWLMPTHWSFLNKSRKRVDGEGYYVPVDLRALTPNDKDTKVVLLWHQSRPLEFTPCTSYEAEVFFDTRLRTHKAHYGGFNIPISINRLPTTPNMVEIEKYPRGHLQDHNMLTNIYSWGYMAYTINSIIIASFKVETKYNNYTRYGAGATATAPLGGHGMAYPIDGIIDWLYYVFAFPDQYAGLTSTGFASVDGDTIWQVDLGTTRRIVKVGALAMVKVNTVASGQKIVFEYSGDGSAWYPFNPFDGSQITPSTTWQFVRAVHSAGAPEHYPLTTPINVRYIRCRAYSGGQGIAVRILQLTAWGW